jgi:hypothetical protein
MVHLAFRCAADEFDWDATEAADPVGLDVVLQGLDAVVSVG